MIKELGDSTNNACIIEYELLKPKSAYVCQPNEPMQKN